MNIKIEKLSPEEINQKNIYSWPVWEKEISEFDWHYDETEICYLLEGEVQVSTEAGATITFGKGDYVTFPQGLSCRWKITSPVKKHYTFTG